MHSKKIIAIEGIDGSGKTVQFNRLKEYLTNEGYNVATMEFPIYSSFFGGILGDFLSGKKCVNASSVDPMSMALWFAMDRVACFEKFDNDYDILLLNRYILSNAVYQGIRCNDIPLKQPMEMIDWVFSLEHDILKLPKPDIYVFLDVAEKQAEQNVENKGFRSYIGDKKDVYESREGMQTSVRHLYIQCAKAYDNIKVVQCMENGQLLSVKEISRMIQAILKQNNIIN